MNVYFIIKGISKAKIYTISDKSTEYSTKYDSF